MANADQMRGFTPVGYINGAPYTGQVRKYYKAAGTSGSGDFYKGDPVIFSGSGDAAGVPAVSKATAGVGNAILGHIVGVELNPDHLDRATWIDGADAGYVFVADDPALVLEVQADDTLTYTDIGNNTNFVQTTSAGSTALRARGLSGIELDATVSAGATTQYRIIGFPQRADNTIALENNKVLVVVNYHVLNGGLAGI